MAVPVELFPGIGFEFWTEADGVMGFDQFPCCQQKKN